CNTANLSQRLRLFLYFLFVDLVIFFFNPPPPTYIYTLSLHDALPIFRASLTGLKSRPRQILRAAEMLSYFSQIPFSIPIRSICRSEEHTSELQSPCNLVCRLLLEKKKTNDTMHCIEVNDSNITTSSSL